MFFFLGSCKVFDWLTTKTYLFVCWFRPKKKQKKHTHTNKAEFGEWILSFWLVVPLGSDKTWKDFHMETWWFSHTPWYRKIIEPQASLPSGSIRSSLGRCVFFSRKKKSSGGLAHGFCIQVCRPSQKTTWQRQSWGKPPNAPKPWRSDPGGKGRKHLPSSLGYYICIGNFTCWHPGQEMKKHGHRNLQYIHLNKNQSTKNLWLVNLFIIIFPYNLA